MSKKVCVNEVQGRFFDSWGLEEEKEKKNPTFVLEGKGVNSCELLTVLSHSAYMVH